MGLNSSSEHTRRGIFGFIVKSIFFLLGSYLPIRNQAFDLIFQDTMSYMFLVGVIYRYIQ